MFFFSSRRRHTRLQGDWSSDVCSSDLHSQILVIPFTSSSELTKCLPSGVKDSSPTAECPGSDARFFHVNTSKNTIRSEERRVGKECRSREWAQRYKANEKRDRGEKRNS